jgi:hypothetical protein
MLVISPYSAFTYKDKPVNAKQIGRELGVRYVLEGSVQRSGDRVRVNSQLIDAETDTHLWAALFDRVAGDLFTLQNEIAGRIAIALNAEILAAEAARSAETSPDALDYILQGRAALAQPPGLDSYGEAIDSFERALALDLHSIEAKGWLANALVARVLKPSPELVQFAGRTLRSRRVQAPNGIDRRRNPIGGAGDPPWPARPLCLQSLSGDWQGAFAAIAH